MKVSNDLENGLDLTIHCKSKDDDLGVHALPKKVAHLNLISNLTFTSLHNSTVVWIGMAHRPNFIFTSIEETWTDAKAFAGGV